MSGKHSLHKSSRRPSKSHTSPASSSNQSQVPETRPPVSFLFIVNELPTNDDPDTPGSVPANLHYGRWYPPDVPEGFFNQRPGRVYRWENGRVSLAPAYNWTARPMGDPVYANGSIYATNAVTHDTIWPEYYRAATVFYCNHFSKFFTKNGDAGTDNVDGWHTLSFLHENNVSCVDHAGDEEYLAVRSASWIEQLLPNTYRRRDHDGPTEGGLAGLLPIVIALVAFSCSRQDLRTVLIDNQAWRGHRWVPHGRPSGRIERRGMVVTVYLDPENPQGSTIQTLGDIEDGYPSPIFR